MSKIIVEKKGLSYLDDSVASTLELLPDIPLYSALRILGKFATVVDNEELTNEPILATYSADELDTGLPGVTLERLYQYTSNEENKQKSNRKHNHEHCNHNISHPK